MGEKTIKVEGKAYFPSLKVYAEEGDTIHYCDDSGEDVLIKVEKVALDKAGGKNTKGKEEVK
jgi:hypothetical protein